MLAVITQQFTETAKGYMMGFERLAVLSHALTQRGKGTKADDVDA